MANSYGQTHEVPNLILAGPGLFPTTGPVNPTFTIHALALRTAEYLVDTLDQLRREGGRMMSVGLHCRIVGRPGRAPALRRFLEHVATCDDVWLASRSDIARHWYATHPRRPDAVR